MEKLLGEKIYYAGIEIFQTMGYSDTNIRAICKAANVSLGSFYNYYKDKRELYFKIFSREYRKLSQSLIEHLIKSEPLGLEKEEVIEKILLTHLKNHSRTILFYVESEVLMIKDPALLELKRTLSRESIEIFLKLLEPKVRKDVNMKVGFPLLHSLVESAIQFTMSKPKREQKKLIKEAAKMVVGYLF